METNENNERKSGLGGFSTEELDKLTTDETAPVIPAEPPKAIIEPAEPPVATPPAEPEKKAEEIETPAAEDKEKAGLEKEKQKLLDDVTALRAAKRTLLTRVSEIETQKTAAVPVVREEPLPKSPFEIEAEKQGIPVDDLTPSVRLLKEQQNWERQQNQKEQLVRFNQDALEAERELAAELSEEKLGVGLDLKTVTTIGNLYLTAGDKVDIARAIQTKGAKAGLKLAYEQSKYRILASGTQDAALLKAAIEAQNSQTKPIKEKTPTQAKQPVTTKVDESETRVNLRPTTSEIIDLMFSSKG